MEEEGPSPERFPKENGRAGGSFGKKHGCAQGRRGMMTKRMRINTDVI